MSEPNPKKTKLEPEALTKSLIGRPYEWVPMQNKFVQRIFKRPDSDTPFFHVLEAWNDRSVKLIFYKPSHIDSLMLFPVEYSDFLFELSSRLKRKLNKDGYDYSTTIMLRKYEDHRLKEHLLTPRLSVFPKWMNWLLCARKYDVDSVFHEDFLPLDIFKRIFMDCKREFILELLTKMFFERVIGSPYNGGNLYPIKEGESFYFLDPRDF